MDLNKLKHEQKSFTSNTIDINVQLLLQTPEKEVNYESAKELIEKFISYARRFKSTKKDDTLQFLNARLIIPQSKKVEVPKEAKEKLEKKEVVVNQEPTQVVEKKEEIK